MKKLWIAFLFTFALPSAALVLLKGDGTSESAKTGRHPQSHDKVSSGEAEARDLLYSPLEGYRYSYSFQRKIRIRGFDNKMPPIAYRGLLHLDVVESDKAGFAALVSEEIQGQSPNRVALKIRTDSRGEALQVFSASPGTEEERQHEAVLKDLLSQMFFTLRSDTVGPYDAKLEFLSSENGYLRARKIKSAYVPGANLPEVVSSLHLLKWNISIGMPDEVRGSESTQMGAGENNLSSEASYLLRFKEAYAYGEVNRGLWASLEHPADLRIDSARPSLQSHPDYAGINWPSLMGQLLDLDALSSGEKLKVFGDLVKLLEGRPEIVERLLKLLRQGNTIKEGADSPLFQTVVGALATAGGTEAQRALREIYGEPECPVSGKGSILSALTTTQAEIDTETRSFLADRMETEENRNLAHGAAFALGSSLEHLEDAGESAEAIERIRQAWGGISGSDLMERLTMLDVIGNSGREEFLPLLSGLVKSQEAESLRAKAVFSLRFMDSSEAKGILAGALSDPGVGVRTAAVNAIALADWDQVFQALLDSCASKDPVAELRDSCSKVINDSRRTVASAN